MTKLPGNKDDKQNRQKTLIIAAVVAVVAIIAVLIAVIVALLTREPVTEIVYEPVVQLIEGPGIGGYERNPGGRGFIVTEDNVEEVRAELEARRLAPEDRYYEASISADWRFATSLTPSKNVIVRNVAGNSRTVFFDITIEGYGVVYVSPYMPLGSEHSNFALDVELPAGTYDAVVTYFLVDDDYNIVSDLSIQVSIKVLQD